MIKKDIFLKLYYVRKSRKITNCLISQLNFFKYLKPSYDGLVKFYVHFQLYPFYLFFLEFALILLFWKVWKNVQEPNWNMLT